MNRRAVVLGLSVVVLFLPIVGAGCGSSTPEGAPPGEGTPSPPEGTEEEPTDATVDAKTRADTGSPIDAGGGDGRKRRVGTERRIGNFDADKTCADVCARTSSFGEYCSGTCNEGRGGFPPGTIGIFVYRGGPTLPITSCSEIAPASSQGKPFNDVECCCETPYVVVKGPMPPTTCNAVCTAQGMTCAADTPWGDPGDLSFDRTGAFAFYHGAEYKWTGNTCDTVFPMTMDSNGDTLELQYYSCGCKDDL